MYHQNKARRRRTRSRKTSSRHHPYKITKRRHTSKQKGFLDSTWDRVTGYILQWFSNEPQYEEKVPYISSDEEGRDFHVRESQPENVQQSFNIQPTQEQLEDISSTQKTIPQSDNFVSPRVARPTPKYNGGTPIDVLSSTVMRNKSSPVKRPPLFHSKPVEKKSIPTDSAFAPSTSRQHISPRAPSTPRLYPSLPSAKDQSSIQESYPTPLSSSVSSIKTSTPSRPVKRPRPGSSELEMSKFRDSKRQRVSHLDSSVKQVGSATDETTSGTPLTYSETAKRILNTLDKLSSPIVDARKISNRPLSLRLLSKQRAAAGSRRRTTPSKPTSDLDSSNISISSSTFSPKQSGQEIHSKENKTTKDQTQAKNSSESSNKGANGPSATPTTQDTVEETPLSKHQNEDARQYSPNFSESPAFHTTPSSEQRGELQQSQYKQKSKQTEEKQKSPETKQDHPHQEKNTAFQFSVGSQSTKSDQQKSSLPTFENKIGTTEEPVGKTQNEGNEKDQENQENNHNIDKTKAEQKKETKEPSQGFKFGAKTSSFSFGGKGKDQASTSGGFSQGFASSKKFGFSKPNQDQKKPSSGSGFTFGVSSTTNSELDQSSPIDKETKEDKTKTKEKEKPAEKTLNLDTNHKTTSEQEDQTSDQASLSDQSEAKSKSPPSLPAPKHQTSFSFSQSGHKFGSAIKPNKGDQQTKKQEPEDNKEQGTEERRETDTENKEESPKQKGFSFSSSKFLNAPRSTSSGGFPSQGTSSIKFSDNQSSSTSGKNENKSDTESSEPSRTKAPFSLPQNNSASATSSEFMFNQTPKENQNQTQKQDQQDTKQEDKQSAAKTAFRFQKSEPFTATLSQGKKDNASDKENQPSAITPSQGKPGTFSFGKKTEPTTEKQDSNKFGFSFGSSKTSTELSFSSKDEKTSQQQEKSFGSFTPKTAEVSANENQSKGSGGFKFNASSFAASSSSFPSTSSTLPSSFGQNSSKSSFPVSNTTTNNKPFRFGQKPSSISQQTESGVKSVTNEENSQSSGSTFGFSKKNSSSNSGFSGTSFSSGGSSTAGFGKPPTKGFGSKPSSTFQFGSGGGNTSGTGGFSGMNNSDGSADAMDMDNNASTPAPTFNSPAASQGGFGFSSNNNSTGNSTTTSFGGSGGGFSTFGSGKEGGGGFSMGSTGSSGGFTPGSGSGLGLGGGFNSGSGAGTGMGGGGGFTSGTGGGGGFTTGSSGGSGSGGGFAMGPKQGRRPVRARRRRHK
eukprot:gb/GECH01008227.1/.p1 GENE.gb/GECH01008227.1/~~gb/GECH01008227.1/.p1  ORF type:complete len:1240 (+),score=319.88 gb/GECH01008227.1/:1-3720(+)